MSDDAPKLPLSPFSSGSWEPRFVIEYYGDAPLRHAIELCGSATPGTGTPMI